MPSRPLWHEMIGHKVVAKEERAVPSGGIAKTAHSSAFRNKERMYSGKSQGFASIPRALGSAPSCVTLLKSSFFVQVQ
jgi:hypothetical protein